MDIKKRIEGLSEEQKAKALACKTPEEMLEFAREEGFDLADEELEAVTGGYASKCSSNDDDWC